MKIQSYLTFTGECQQALNFYKNIFGGTIHNRETYEDKEIDIPENYRDKLQHAELKGNGFHIMAYDAAPDTPVTNGTNVQLGVDLNDEKEAEDTFNQLSKGGKVHTPFQKTSWGALYGRCTDQFGINWMVNCKL